MALSRVLYDEEQSQKRQLSERERCMLELGPDRAALHEAGCNQQCTPLDFWG